MKTGRMVALAIMAVVVAGLAATPGLARPSGESSQRATHKTFTDHGHIEIGHQRWPCAGFAESCGGVTEGQFRATCRIDKVFPEGTQGLDAHVFKIPHGFDAPGSKLTVAAIAAAGSADLTLLFLQAYPQDAPDGLRTHPCRTSGVTQEEVDVDISPGTRWVVVSGPNLGQVGHDIDVTMKLTTPIRTRAHRD